MYKHNGFYIKTNGSIELYIVVMYSPYKCFKQYQTTISHFEVNGTRSQKLILSACAGILFSPEKNF